MEATNMKLLSSMSLSTKLIAMCLFAMIAVVAVNYVVFTKGYRQDAQEALMEKAAAFTAVADEAKTHASQLMAQGAIDTPKLVGEALEEIKNGKSYSETKFFGAIPVVVGWQTAEKAAKRENIDFRVVAFDARNKKNEPEAGSFREQMLRELTTQVKSGGKETIGRIDEKTNTLHFMRAIKLDETCMSCHGDPAKYDRKDDEGNYDGKDVLGFRMESWAPGDMHGAYEVAMPLAPMDDQVAGFLTGGMTYTVPLVVGCSLAFIFFLRSMLTKPVNRLVAMVQDIAQGEGDLTKRIEIQREDEIGQLAKWFDKFMDNLQDIIRQVSSATREVAAAATEIAASSEEMSASVGEVARQAAQASESAQQSGQIASQGGEIVSQTVQTMKELNGSVTESSQSVSELGQRGQQIGQIIAVINDIADQTNLLALNAAIEAARAGEHGRGFAVVADEVRKLAERTTKATEEIGGSITAIQTETQRAVERMTVGVDQVKSGVSRAETAGESLQQIVKGATEVAGMIQSISAASEEAGAGAAQSAEAANQLSAKAEQLQALVGRFRVENEPRTTNAAPTTTTRTTTRKAAKAAA